MFKNLSREGLGISASQREVIELALSNGFRGIDFDLAEFIDQAKTRGLDTAKRQIEGARLKMSSFRLPVRWQQDSAEYQQDLECLGKLAEVAQAIGCTRTTTTIEPASDSRPYHENFEHHRRRLSEVAQVLAPFGIRLGLEFLAPLKLRSGKAFQFLQTADAAIFLMRSLGSPNVGLSIDLWHWHLGGGTPEQLRALGAERVVSVTLSDAEAGISAEASDESGRLLPGEAGTIDAAAALTALSEMRYDGPVAPRSSPQNLQGMGRDKIVERAAAALDAVWKAAGIAPVKKVGTRA